MNNAKRPVKHRRGAYGICNLIRAVRSLDTPGHKGHKVLSQSAINAERFLKLRAIAQKEPERSLNSAVIVVALQEGILTDDQFENELRPIHYDKPQWNGAIDLLFERLMGRLPDRSRQALAQEADLVWRCIKLPFSEEQLQYLLRADDYRMEHARAKTLSREDRLLFYYKPLTFDDPRFTEKPVEDQSSNDDTQDDTSGEALRRWIDARLSQADDDSQAYGGRYGYLPGTRQVIKAPKEQAQKDVGNPEQVDHADQQRIDMAFAELMAGIL